MVKAYFCTNNTTHVGTLGTNNRDLELTVGSGTLNSGVTHTTYFYSPSSEPGTTDWNGGIYRFILFITGANSNFTWSSVTMRRLNSARTTTLASKSATINSVLNITGIWTGEVTWNDGTQNPVGRSSTDTFAVDISITKTGGHGGDSITYGFAVPFPPTCVDTPLGTSTRLFFHAATDSTSGLPTAEQSPTWTSSFNAEGSQTTNRVMDEDIGTSQTSLTDNAITTTVEEHYFTRFVSPPLNMSSIPAAHWIYLFAAESNNADSFYPTNELDSDVNINMYVWRPSNQTKIGTIFEGEVTGDCDETQYVNNEKILPSIFTGSSVGSLSEGDVLICEIWIGSEASTTGPYTGIWYYDGTTEETYRFIPSGASSFPSYLEPNGLELTFSTGEPPAAAPEPNKITHMDIGRAGRILRFEGGNYRPEMIIGARLCMHIKSLLEKTYRCLLYKKWASLLNPILAKSVDKSSILRQDSMTSMRL